MLKLPSIYSVATGEKTVQQQNENWYLMNRFLLHTDLLK